jgi:hypothetical protein
VRTLHRSSRHIARELAAFSIYPALLRIGQRRAKGYKLADFAQAFDRSPPDS